MRPPRLGDLVSFTVGPTNPCDLGLVVEVRSDFVVVLWSWGQIECSVGSFMGERWGNIKVVTDDN
jgi:hypothetical protein